MREVIQQIFDPGDALKKKLLAVDLRNRTGAYQIASLDTASGDDDFLDLRGFLRRFTRLCVRCAWWIENESKQQTNDCRDEIESDPYRTPSAGNHD